MFRFSPKRSLFVRLVTSLGPPPPPPRRHFSKLSDPGALYHAQGGRPAGGHHGGTHRARRAA
jgi:hypothetical protein